VQQAMNNTTILYTMIVIVLIQVLNRKPICDFLLVINSRICYRFWDIHT